MSKILLDVNCPRRLAYLLAPHTVQTAAERGWGELTNGDLLSAAEWAGFDTMITADRNLSYQQNLAARRIALVVLSTNAWPVIRDAIDLVVAALDAARAGSYTTVEFERPPLNRRPAPRFTP